LHQYPSFRASFGLSFVPHISTFPRVGNWFRNAGIPLIHKQTLQHMNLGLIPCILIDSTALRSSLYDAQAKIAPVLLQDIQNQNVLFSVADSAYDSQHLYKIARMCNIFAMHPKNGEQIKSTHRRVLLYFVQTIFSKQLMKEREKIEKQFSKLKIKGWNNQAGMVKIALYCMFS